MKIALHVYMIMTIIAFSLENTVPNCKDASSATRGTVSSLECDLVYERKCHDIPQRNCEEVKYTIYKNGTIYTVNGTDWFRCPKQALVVKADKIEFIGTNEEADNYLKCRSKVIDLKGNTVLPGFHDVHIHPLESGSPVGGTCNLPPNTAPDKMSDILKTCKGRQIGTDWILGHGHSITNMLKYIDEKDSRPPKAILDDVIEDQPAIMMEETSHSVWVNSKALEMANITKDTPERPGGVIMREKNSNEPNGILFEDEGIAIMEYAMKPTEKLEELNYEGLVDSLSFLNENGITSLCDARLYWTRHHGKAWDDLCNEKNLTVRAILGLWAYPQKDDNDQIETLKNLYSAGNDNCFLRKSQIKVYMDGLLESTTAAVKKPYEIDLHLPGITDNRGMNIFTEERLTKYVRALQSFDDGRKGFDFHVHAIGDRGIHQALNSFENASELGTRHRLTHLELIDNDDIYRFKELGVIADFQVAGNFTLPSEREHVSTVIGNDRAQDFIPVKTVSDTGAIVTLSSDWDVSTPNPFIGIQHAISRGNQSIDVKTAIEMYTINAAYTMRQENVVGSLVYGKDADFIVIDKDILDSRNLDSIHRTKVLLTVLAGKEVYSSRSFEKNMENKLSMSVQGPKVTISQFPLAFVTFYVFVTMTSFFAG